MALFLSPPKSLLPEIGHPKPPPKHRFAGLENKEIDLVKLPDRFNFEGETN